VTGNSASAAPKQSGGLSLQSFAQDYVGNGPYTGRDVVPNHQGDIIDAGASGLSGGGNGSASGSGGKGGGDDGGEAICFAAGTRIATPSGEVPVESLRIGGMVLTHRGEAAAITWIGKGTVPATSGRFGAPMHVIVVKDALADNMPHADLHVTKGHSLYLDDVLIPVEFLVNHRSIIWDDRAQEVEIYHIELAAHDVLVANGAPAESYRDDGNRRLFQNVSASWHEPPKLPFAPVLTGGPAVDAIWRRLLDRSGMRLDLPTTNEPDLHLLVDGHRVDGRRLRDGVHAFRLPKPLTTVRIVSRASAQDELGLARDPRLLGVALRQMLLWQGRQLKTLEAADAMLCKGFHQFEPDNNFRWTNGNAEVPTALFENADGICELQLHVGCTTRYQLFEDPSCLAA
jgi:hypothetical protein